MAIRVKDIEVTSLATSSGNDQPMEGRFNGDPYCAPVCPGCGTEWPETRVEGIGQESVRCASCGADCTPFTFTNGYTIAFDELRSARGHRPARGRRGLRPRRGALRGAARQLRPEPDPRLRAARHRRARHAGAPLHGPAWNVPFDPRPGLPQRGRLRSRSWWRPAPLRARRRRSCSATRPTGTSTSTLCAPARSSSARSNSTAPVSTSATCTHCRATGRSPGHTCDVSGTVTLQVEVLKGTRATTGRSSSHSRRTCRSWPGR